MVARRPSSSRAAKLRRQQIVDGAFSLLREREASKVIVTDIAVAAGVSPATVYNLVGTRDEVMRAVLETAVAEVANKTEPVDPEQPLEAITGLLSTTAEVLLADATAYRRAIAAMSDAGDGGWLQTTIGELLAARLATIGDCFDGTIPPSRLAELIQIGVRGVLISWSYGHLPNDRLGPTGIELALHVLHTTARADIAEDIRERLTKLAEEAS